MNVKKAFTYYGPGGVPQTGAELILKDIDGVESDVVMTELGSGVYTAVVTLGTMWKVYDNANPPGVDTGFMLEAGYSTRREPAISEGNATYVWTGKKVWTQLTRGMIVGLNSALDTLTNLLSQESSTRKAEDQKLSVRIDALSDSVTLAGVKCSPRHLVIDILHETYPDGEYTIFHLGTAPADGSWTIPASLDGNMPVGAVGARSFPFTMNVVPGVITEGVLTLGLDDIEVTAGVANIDLCDFQFRVGVSDVGGAKTYSGWADAKKATSAMNQDASQGSASFSFVLPSPFVITKPGGTVIVEAKAKVKTNGTPIVLGSSIVTAASLVEFMQVG